MSAHTPGPWLILPEESDKPYLRIRGNRLGGQYKIANVLTAGDAETLANARLIAAAPELLEALKQAIEALSCGDPNARMNALRDCPAAVVKAEAA